MTAALDENAHRRRQNPNYVGQVDRNAHEQYRFYVGEHEGRNMFRIELWKSVNARPFEFWKTIISLRVNRLPAFETATVRAVETAKVRGLE